MKRYCRHAVQSLSLLALLGSAGCRPNPADVEGSGIPGQCLAEAPKLEPQKTDILFVIDNSNSMSEEQEGVATELPAFVAALQAGGAVAQDFRVGVITTSIYMQYEGTDSKVEFVSYPNESGRLQLVPNADGTMPASPVRFIEGTDPQLNEKFQRLVKRGVIGSGQETAFEAALRAVTPPLSQQPVAQGGNAEFLRDGARLLVVVVTDEDDCSERSSTPQVVIGTDRSRDYCREQASKLTPVSEYVQAFKSLTDSTGKPREVLWAAIAPVALSDKRAEAAIEGGVLRNAECPTSFGPGYRHREMAEAFNPSLRNLDSICRTKTVDGQQKADYRDSLLAIAAIANENQSLEVGEVPDPNLIQVALTRANGEVQKCTVANGDLTWEPAAAEGEKARIRFNLDTCPRRYDDKKVELTLLCAM